MYKKWVGLLIISTISINSFACDICGAGAGGGYLGLLPGFRKKFISMRYSHNSLFTHLGPNGTNTYLTTRENFNTWEIWGAANIGQRFRIAGFIPYNQMQRKNQSGRSAQDGIGDISVIGYYQLFNKQNTTSTNKAIIQSLWLGAGLKTPTGRFNAKEKNIQESTINTFQLGTGSTDFSLHALYDLRYQDAGININSSFRYNTTNANDYRYGNKFTLNLLAYYKFRMTKKISLSPNTGILYEQSAKDEIARSIRVWETGGRSCMGTLGLEASFGKMGMGLSMQTPLAQDLGEGKLKARNRSMIYVSYSF